MKGRIVSIPEGLKINLAKAFVSDAIGPLTMNALALNIGYKQGCNFTRKKYTYLGDRQRELDQMLRDQR